MRNGYTVDILSRLIVVSLATYGLATAIAVLKAGKPIRDLFEWLETKTRDPVLRAIWTFFKTLFKCPPCLSFWIGMASSVWVMSITKGLVAQWWMAMVMDGLIVCGTSWLLHLAAERLGYGLDV